MKRTFSLQTLIIAGCFIAAALAVWRKREPWRLESRVSCDWGLDWPKVSRFSPDNTREIYAAKRDVTLEDYTWPGPGVWAIRDLKHTFAIGLPVVDTLTFWDANFQDDNTIVMLGDHPDNEFKAVVYTFKRRFPEWWWGHFYRPELWAAVVLGVVWIWRIVRRILGRRRAALY